MMQISNEDKALIIRMIEHCDRIADIVKRMGNSFEDFDSDPVYRDAINMNIFQVGELSNHLSDTLKNSLSEVPWNSIYGIRNILAHAYIIVDTQTVWNTVKNDIPKFRKTLQSVINNM